MSKVKEVGDNKAWQGCKETDENVKHFSHFAKSSKGSSHVDIGKAIFLSWTGGREKYATTLQIFVEISQKKKAHNSSNYVHQTA